MPWQNNTLWRQKFSDLLEPVGLPEAVGAGLSSKSQPHWTVDGSLYFLDDISGWWNIWRQTAGGSVDAISPIEADLGRAQWELGSSSFRVLANGNIVAIASRQGIDRLLTLEPKLAFG